MTLVVRKGKRNGFFDYAQNDEDTLRMMLVVTLRMAVAWDV